MLSERDYRRLVSDGPVRQVRPAAQALFKSFFMGGFECSTHRTRQGRRLDMIGATAHDTFAAEDYARLKGQGINTVRDGLRWHLIEKRPYTYDFSSMMPILRAARATQMEVIWDICHYGWPDDIDIFKPEFVRRFASLARAFARFLAHETDSPPLVAPINEISFLSWAAGEVAYFYPFHEGRGFELKAQLARAAIEGAEAVWDIQPHARIVHSDPVINVVADPAARPAEQDVVRRYCLAQYQAWDMVAGRLWPQLGGAEKYLDIIGVNYYPHNQWVHGSLFFNPSAAIDRADPRYRPFRDLLREVYERYRRPMFIAETGAEGDARPGWLRYVCDEVRAAINTGVQIEGVCLYPIVNHPGWDDDRHCHNGLWDYADERGGREIYDPLAGELRRQHAAAASGR